MEFNNANESDTLQSVVIISDGYYLDDYDSQIAFTMLKNFMEVNMAFVFGIFPNGEDKLFQDMLSNYLYTYSFSDAVGLFNIEAGQIYTDIVNQLILKIGALLSVSNNNNIQVTDELHLIVDNELVYGSTLEIEYEITVYALNGITEFYITDYVEDTGLVYLPDSPLLTANGTNKDMGWRDSEDGVTVSSAYGNGESSQQGLPTTVSKKIVLSKLIGTNDRNIYVNNAVCGTSSYGVGESSAASYRRVVQSEYVRIIPPTGTKNYYNIIIPIAIVAIIIIFVFVIKKKIKNKAK